MFYFKSTRWLFRRHNTVLAQNIVFIQKFMQFHLKKYFFKKIVSTNGCWNIIIQSTSKYIHENVYTCACVRACVCVCVCVCVWYFYLFSIFARESATIRNSVNQPSYTSIIKETCISISQPFTTLNCHSTFSFCHRLIFYSFSLHSIVVTSLHISIAHLLLRKKAICRRRPHRMICPATLHI
jgi:hypothetical protein